MNQNIRMKSIVVILLILFSTQFVYSAQKKKTSPDTATETQEQKAINSFKKVANDFSNFFKTNPKFVAKIMPFKTQKADKPIYYYIEQHMFQESAFDVRKTDSLVSPFFGYIDIVFDDKSNKNCGDVKSGLYNKIVGFSEIEKALEKDGDDCLQIQLKQRKNRFEFAFQSNKWILKKIKFFTKDEILNNDFMEAVLGMKAGDLFLFMDEPQGINYNKKLTNFIKPYLE
jgi:hypothetical protein